MQISCRGSWRGDLVKSIRHVIAGQAHSLTILTVWVANEICWFLMKSRNNAHSVWSQMRAYENIKHVAEVCFENYKVMQGEFNGFFIMKQIKKPWHCALFCWKARRKRQENESREKHSTRSRFPQLFFRALAASGVLYNRTEYSRSFFILSFFTWPDLALGFVDERSGYKITIVSQWSHGHAPQ